MTAQEVIKAFMNSLDNTTKTGTDALNEAVQACSNFSTMQEVIDSLIADCKSSSSATAFLQNYCGIILGNSDTGAITGSDAGTTTTKTAESIVPETGSASYPSSTTFTIKGLTVTVPEQSTLTTEQQTVIQGLYSWWIEEALDLIEESYGLSFTENGTTVRSINVKFENVESSTTLAYVTTGYSGIENSAMKGTTLTLTVNMAKFTNLSSTDENGNSSLNIYLDRVIAHELTHAVMSANVLNTLYLPTFVMEGLAELTHGVDDTRRYEINTIASNPSTLASLLSLDSTSTTSSSQTYAAGYILFRYLAYQAAGTVVSNPNDISNSTSLVTVTGTSTADTIQNSGSSVTIKADSGNDTISNSGSNVVIISGAGDDTINNTATGNIYSYANGDGNDIIQGFTSSDTIKITSGSISNYSFSGGDLIITVGSGSITVKEASSKIVNISDASNNVLVISNGNVFFNTIPGITLNGTSSNDSIYSTGANVTINGGTGNDTISGSGSQLIQYASGDGNDVINYSSSDTLQITYGSIDGYSISGEDVILNIGSGTLTIKNAKSQSVNIIDSSGNFSTKIFGPLTINNSSDNILINGGNYEDSIYSSGYNVTINGGTGNDTILGSGSRLIQYANGDGNDIINYSSADTLKITSGSIDNYYINGNDVIFNIGNGTIIIKDAKSQPINIIDSSGTLSTKIYGPLSIANSNNDVLLSGSKYNDYIYNTGSNVTINGGIGDDTIEGYGSKMIQYASGDGNDTIAFNANDTLRITSGGIDNYSISGNDVILNIGSGYLTLKNAKSLAVNIVDSSGNFSTKYFGPAYIINSHNDSNLTLTGSDYDDTIINYASTSSISVGSGDDYIFNNSSNVTINAGKGNDTISGLGSKVIEYSTGDGDDVIYNFTANDTLNIASGEITSATTEGNDAVIYIGSGSVKLSDAATKSINIKTSSGEFLTTIIGAVTIDTTPASTTDTTPAATSTTDTTPASTSTADTTSASTSTTDTTPASTSTSTTDTIPASTSTTDTTPASTSTTDTTPASTSTTDTTPAATLTTDTTPASTSTTDTISTSVDDTPVTIEGYIEITNDDDKTYTASSSDQTIDASKRAFTVKLIGNSKDNTIIGGRGNSTLTGKNGADTFVYTAGKTVITDYSTSDKISLGGSAELVSSSLSGSTVVITTDDGTIRINNGRSKSINILDSNGESTYLVHGKSSKDTIMGTSSNDSIFGNGGADSLNGNKGADTLTGGKGADTLTGGLGADVFVYKKGDGKDVITDYTSVDSIKIEGVSDSQIKTSSSGNDVILKVGSGSITLKNALGKTLNLITDDNYYSSNALSSLMTSNTQIVTNNNYSSTSTLSDETNKLLSNGTAALTSNKTSK